MEREDVMSSQLQEMASLTSVTPGDSFQAEETPHRKRRNQAKRDYGFLLYIQDPPWKRSINRVAKKLGLSARKTWQIADEDHWAEKAAELDKSVRDRIVWEHRDEIEKGLLAAMSISSASLLELEDKKKNKEKVDPKEVRLWWEILNSVKKEGISIQEIPREIIKKVPQVNLNQFFGFSIRREDGTTTDEKPPS